MAVEWKVHFNVIYTKNQAEGALRNGSRVEKVNSEFGDGHQDGAVGTVIGSLGHAEIPGSPDRYVYFVAWDEDPGAGLPVGIREGRVKVLKDVSHDKAPIVFKCEASLWEMLAQVNPDGRSAKPFDMRRWDINDERINRLSWGLFPQPARTSAGDYIRPFTKFLPKWEEGWEPVEKEVGFFNKATGELLTFEYLGVEFAPWARGWGFLILGKRLQPPSQES